MKIILIGSTLFSATPRDWDIICEDASAEFGGFDQITPTEADTKWIFSGDLNDYLIPTVNRIPGLEDHALFVPTRELLAHIYRSHLTSFRRGWYKHCKTFHETGLCELYEANEDDRLTQYAKEREKEYRHLSNTRSWTLKGMTKDDFFGDNVKYYQDHDSVHAAVAFDPQTPAYTYMQEEGAEVECSRSLWNAMTDEQRLNCVKEEMAVIAIERVIAPLYFSGEFSKMNIVKALRVAAYKLHTTLSSGWFREFVVRKGFQAYSELATDTSWLSRWLAATKAGEVERIAA